MKLARMERRRRPDGTNEWVTAQGYELRDGMRAAIGVEALPRKKR
jgi:hypothetical protein